MIWFCHWNPNFLQCKRCSESGVGEKHMRGFVNSTWDRLLTGYFKFPYALCCIQDLSPIWIKQEYIGVHLRDCAVTARGAGYPNNIWCKWYREGIIMNSTGNVMGFTNTCSCSMNRVELAHLNCGKVYEYCDV